jgi:hypothetical protein
LIGCADSLEVKFTGATTKPGRYQVEVVADGVPTTCQMTLPQSCGAPPFCFGGSAMWRFVTAGCAAGQGPQSIEGFTFYTAGPASLDFIVRRDDVVVGGGSAQPVYKESRPNGPECDPVCRQAAPVQVEIAP